MANIPGTEIPETLVGGLNDDYFTPGGGDDVVFGNAGTDTAALTGTSYDYSISISKSITNGVYAFVVKTVDLRAGSPDGSDEFRFVERLQFANGIMDVDTGAATNLNHKPTGLQLSTSALVEHNSTDAPFATVSATDPEGGPLIYSLANDANGAFHLEGDKLFANESFDSKTTPTEKITVQVTDDFGFIVSKDFTISILSLNKAPIVTDDVGAIQEHEMGNIAVLQNDSDPDNDLLSISAATITSGSGTVTINDDGTLGVSYFGLDLDPEQSAQIAITYAASDGSVEVPGTLTVTVEGASEPGDDIEGNSKANALVGTKVGELIKGLGGKDTISGNGGADTIDGGKGNDALTGNAGADIFLFHKGDGKDTITDFSLKGGDVIDLSDVAGIVNFKDLLKNHVADTKADDLIITIDAHNSIVLEGIHERQLTTGDFFL